MAGKRTAPDEGLGPLQLPLAELCCVHPECADVPIVMATGELEPEERPGVLQVLSKPYKLEELYAAVAAALAR